MRCHKFVAALLFAVALGPAAHAELRPSAARQPAQSSVAYDPTTHIATLTAQGAYEVVYTIDLDDPSVRGGLLRVSASVGGSPPTTVVSGGGTRYRNALQELLLPDEAAALGSPTMTGQEVTSEEVVLRFQEQPGVHVLTKTYRLRVEGLSLVIEATSDTTWGLDGYAGLSLGHAEAPGSRVVQLPYLPEPIALLPDGLVLTAFLDPTVSSSASIQRLVGEDASGDVFAHAASTSELDTAGVSPPLFERAYVTLAPELQQVFPVVDTGPSPYRTALSDRVVMDVWGLHRAFSVPEGVALVWTASAATAAQVELLVNDANAGCGDGVEVVLRQGGSVIARRHVENGATAQQSMVADLELQQGESVRAEVLRAGTNACDGTALHLGITTPSDGFDSVADFSSTQGGRGFSYLETADGVDTPMTYDAGSSCWVGSGAYAMLCAGSAHPGEGKTAYRDARNMVRRYREYGMTELALIFHVWQRWGYDAGLPDHHPANPAFGTGSEMAAFIEQARDAGMLVALHENYTDMYPDASPDHPSPLYDLSAIARDREGNLKLGWLNEGTGQQAYRIASSRMLGFANDEASGIVADYHPNATYLDVHTGWSPSIGMDHDATKGAVPSLASTYEQTMALYDAMRGHYDGPLFGEGGEGADRFDSYFAGAVDGVERQTEGRSRAWVAPDYEQLAVKPRMLNHGMGYYARYFVDEGHAAVSFAQADLDQYRASQIAFGHAGFLGDSLDGVPSWIRLHAAEYWLMQPLQARYADAAISRIVYEHAAEEVDLEEALRRRWDLSQAHVRVEYDDGLRVWVNREGAGGEASSVLDFSHELGHWRYIEAAGGVVSPLTWDPAARVWRGAGPYAMIGQYSAHPDGPPIVRAFVAPSTGSYHLTGRMEDADTSCGDGVKASLTLGSTVLWECDLPDDSASPCGSFDVTADANATGVFFFRIEQKTDNSCDSTLMTARIAWSEGWNHDWTIATHDGAVTLPPAGFFAEDTSGFRAFTMRAADDQLVDGVRSLTTIYARSRALQAAAIGGVRTDGSIAIVPGPHGLELHGLELTEAELDGAPLLRSSVPADVNLRFLDAHSALVGARGLAQGEITTLTWSALPDAWSAALAVDPGALAVHRADDDGNPQGPAEPWSLDATGSVVLDSMTAEQPYLLLLTLECGDGVCDSAADEDCGTCPADCLTSAAQVCCGGGLHDGDCCVDGDCGGAVKCEQYLCAKPGADGGTSSGPGDSDNGCGCRLGATARRGGWWPWLLAIVIDGGVRRRYRCRTAAGDGT